jgi:hypothetical protein
MSDTSDGKLYAVFRNGVRVSEAEYPSPLFAQKELEHWQSIVKRFPDGSKLEIRPIGKSE